MKTESYLQVLLLLTLGGGAGGSYASDLPADPVPLRALLNEARAYEHGEGVQKDPVHAIRLYCNGARQGNAEAQYSLGWMYANGRGIARDDSVAAYFFALAARQGHEQARRMLTHVGAPPRRGPECMLQQPSSREEPEDKGLFEANSPAQRKILDLVMRLAPQYGVNPHLALAVIQTESNFNSSAVSPKNARGVMQLIPETAARFNVSRPFDPEQNIRGGLAYLRWLLAYFKGNVTLVAAAYNAGEGAVNRFRGIPPFAETRSYVKRVKGIFKKDEHPYDQSVTDPSPELSRIQATRLL